MLQQTQVNTVIPYYERFLKKFPTLTTLAHAEEDEVLAAWSGLGYYRRARLLHRGVSEVLTQYGGEVPVDATLRKRLPGVGDYTAGAIGSVAFGLREPIVDGNVTRVLSRVFAINAAVGSKESRQNLWALATQYAQSRRPGDANQALMELGALVCTKHHPSCKKCPIRSQCAAFQKDSVADFPKPQRRKTAKRMNLVAALAFDQQERVWLERSVSGLFSGLWLPVLKKASTFDAEYVREYFGQRAYVDRRDVQIKHVLTHRVLSVDVCVIKRARKHVGSRNKRQNECGRWFEKEELTKVGVPTLTKKLIAAGLGR